MSRRQGKDTCPTNREKGVQSFVRRGPGSRRGVAQTLMDGSSSIEVWGASLTERQVVLGSSEGELCRPHPQQRRDKKDKSQKYAQQRVLLRGGSSMPPNKIERQ